MKKKIEQAIVAVLATAIFYLAVFSEFAEKNPELVVIFSLFYLVPYTVYKLLARRKQNEKRI